MLSKELKDAGFKLTSAVSTSVFHHPIFGMINLNNLSVAEAHRLVKTGFSGLTYTKTKSISEPQAVEPLLQNKAANTTSVAEETKSRKTDK